MKNSLSEAAQRWKEKILAAECSVSLHFRLGDFIYSTVNQGRPSVFAIAPLDYYYRCIEILRREHKNLSLFIFSDNLKWVKENFRSDCPTEFIEGCAHDVEELHLMSLCKHNIISKSTFSWWGAWLNPNPDKKVFTPALTDGEKPIKSPTNLIDSPNWIEISFDISEQPAVEMPPYFSLLLVVNNDSATLPATLDSLFGQDYKYYEVIIIDNASTDGSGKICRQVAKAHDNVTLIKLHEKVQNGAAWNIAFKAAQGHYVLFLKGNDLISYDALTSLYLMNEHILADVINSFVWLRKSNVADKKFSLEKISAFKNVQGVFRDKLDKLMILKVLTNGEIFPPLGTRIFNREFLMENKIEFSEAIGDDAELLFTLNAMFQTNEIIFIPKVYYIMPS